MLKKKSHKRLAKRKAMIATWDNEYIPFKEKQDDKEKETSNYYFMEIKVKR